jgi:hypothetical protein
MGKKRITVTISDDNWSHVQKEMKKSDLTESEAVDYFIEKDRVKLFTAEDVKIVQTMLKK